MINKNSFFGNVGASTPPIVKNLLIINGLMFLASLMFGDFMYSTFSLYFPTSPNFKVFQLLTHMFMHADFFHLLFNMYALWMFGGMVEKIWGGKKFLFYYLVTGLGAMVLHMFVQWILLYHTNTYNSMEVAYLVTYTRTLGASGAVFGILLAFGMLFPHAVLQLIFPPIRLKAIWFVIIYGAIELFLGFTRTSGGVAHFAHVGGMLFGFILIKYWKHKGTLFRNDDYHN